MVTLRLRNRIEILFFILADFLNMPHLKMDGPLFQKRHIAHLNGFRFLTWGLVLLPKRGTITLYNKIVL